MITIHEHGYTGQGSNRFLIRTVSRYQFTVCNFLKLHSLLVSVICALVSCFGSSRLGSSNIESTRFRFGLIRLSTAALALSILISILEEKSLDSGIIRTSDVPQDLNLYCQNIYKNFIPCKIGLCDTWAHVDVENNTFSSIKSSPEIIRYKPKNLRRNALGGGWVI